MSNKKQTEELQSRREFFKKAAKAALPVVGAVVMASLPHIAQAAEQSNLCQYSCTAMCADNCSGYCQGSCTSACARSCASYCNAGCNTTCRGVSY